MIINATLSGVDTTATATAGDILASKTAWVNDQKITGTIPTKTASNLTASGATVTVPAGYYASQVTKSIANGSATTPATTITQSTPSLSVASSTGIVTASVAQKTQNVTPTVSAGYVSTGTAGTITLGSSSNTLQLSTQAAKTVTPSESSQTAVAAGKYTTGAVTVGAISTTYVGSGIARKSSSDLTVSGATVTAPAGYYASAASKSVTTMTLPTATSTSASGSSAMSAIGRSTSTRYINIPVGYNDTAKYYTISAVANGSATTPATTITQSTPTLSVASGTGIVTASVAQKTQNVTPTVSAGYVSAGTAGTITLGTSSGTLQLTTQAAKTVTPTTSSQTAVAAGRYTTGAVTVAAISSNYKALTKTPSFNFFDYRPATSNNIISDTYAPKYFMFGNYLYYAITTRLLKRTIGGSDEWTTESQTFSPALYNSSSSYHVYSACNFYNNNFYIITAQSSSSNKTTMTWGFWKFDGSTWTTLANPPSGWFSGTATDAAYYWVCASLSGLSNKIYLFMRGFYDSNNYQICYATYDINSNTWSSSRTIISALNNYTPAGTGSSANQSSSISDSSYIYFAVRATASPYYTSIYKINSSGTVSQVANLGMNSSWVNFFKKNGNVYVAYDGTSGSQIVKKVNASSLTATYDFGSIQFPISAADVKVFNKDDLLIQGHCSDDTYYKLLNVYEFIT